MWIVYSVISLVLGALITYLLSKKNSKLSITSKLAIASKKADERRKLAIKPYERGKNAISELNKSICDLKVEQKKIISSNPFDPKLSSNIITMKKFKRNKPKIMKQVIEEYKLAIQLDPSFVEAHYNLGDLFYELNRYEEAIEQFKLAIDYDTCDPPNLNNPPKYYSHNFKIYFYLGNALKKIRRYEDAIEQYKLGIHYDTCGHNLDISNNIGNSLIELKRYEEAIDRSDLSIQYNSYDPTAYNNKGLSLYYLKL